MKPNLSNRCVAYLLIFSLAMGSAPAQSAVQKTIPSFRRLAGSLRIGDEVLALPPAVSFAAPGSELPAKVNGEESIAAGYLPAAKTGVEPLKWIPGSIRRLLNADRSIRRAVIPHPEGNLTLIRHSQNLEDGHSFALLTPHDRVDEYCDEPAGFVLDLIHSAKKESILVLKSLFLIPYQQRKGIGRRIFEWLALAAVNEEISEFRVDNTNNPDILRLFFHVVDPDSLVVRILGNLSSSVKKGALLRDMQTIDCYEGEPFLTTMHTLTIAEDGGVTINWPRPANPDGTPRAFIDQWGRQRHTVEIIEGMTLRVLDPEWRTASGNPWPYATRFPRPVWISGRPIDARERRAEPPIGAAGGPQARKFKIGDTAWVEIRGRVDRVTVTGSGSEDSDDYRIQWRTNDFYDVHPDELFETRAKACFVGPATTLVTGDILLSPDGHRYRINAYEPAFSPRVVVTFKPPKVLYDLEEISSYLPEPTSPIIVPTKEFEHEQVLGWAWIPRDEPAATAEGAAILRTAA